MRARIFAVLAYTGAAITLVLAILVPFVLLGGFTGLVARAGLHVDASYSGGDIARVFDRNGYQVAVYRPVQPHFLQRVHPFVQIAFKPAHALPPRIDEEVDLDGDGRPDVRIVFAVPASPDAPLHGDVIALNGSYRSLANVGGDSFSELLVRTGDQILVRVPFRGASPRN